MPAIIPAREHPDFTAARGSAPPSYPKTDSEIERAIIAAVIEAKGDPAAVIEDYEGRLAEVERQLARQSAADPFNPNQLGGRDGWMRSVSHLIEQQAFLRSRIAFAQAIIDDGEDSAELVPLNVDACAADALRLFLVVGGPRALEAITARAEMHDAPSAHTLGHLANVIKGSPAAYAAGHKDSPLHKVEEALRVSLYRTREIREKAEAAEALRAAFKAAFPAAAADTIGSTGAKVLAVAAREATIDTGGADSEPGEREARLRRERSTTVQKLGELGFTPESRPKKGDGLMAQTLDDRRVELDGQIAELLKSRKALGMPEAEALVASAATGDLRAWAGLLRLVIAAPGAFPGEFRAAMCEAAADAMCSRPGDSIAWCRIAALS